MRTTPMQVWAGVLLTLPTISALPIQPQSTDIVQSGPYTIEHCGSNASVVTQNLDLIWSALQLVMADTHSGTASPAYATFFKDSIYDTFVDEMFTNISSGAPIPKSVDAHKVKTTSPIIRCLAAPEEIVPGQRTMYDFCANAGLEGTKDFTAFYWYHTSNIFICPSFFTYLQQPTLRPGQTTVCPNVADSQFHGHWEVLVQNQVYLLLHEIVNFYLRNNPGPVRYWAAEVGDINKATSLSALQAVGNAQSYVFYAAMVAEKCTSFPASDSNTAVGGSGGKF